jgi:hypothetical protein
MGIAWREYAGPRGASWTRRAQKGNRQFADSGNTAVAEKFRMTLTLIQEASLAQTYLFHLSSVTLHLPSRVRMTRDTFHERCC